MWLQTFLFGAGRTEGSRGRALGSRCHDNFSSVMNEQIVCIVKTPSTVLCVWKHCVKSLHTVSISTNYWSSTISFLTCYLHGQTMPSVSFSRINWWGVCVPQLLDLLSLSSSSVFMLPDVNPSGLVQCGKIHSTLEMGMSSLKCSCWPIASKIIMSKKRKGQIIFTNITPYNLYGKIKQLASRVVFFRMPSWIMMLIRFLCKWNVSVIRASQDHTMTGWLR